jgi:hypothetical protein
MTSDSGRSRVPLGAEAGAIRIDSRRVSYERCRGPEGIALDAKVSGGTNSGVAVHRQVCEEAQDLQQLAA